MTIPWHDRFRMYPEEDKADLLLQVGTYLTSRRWHECTVNLYFMGTFFGEVFFHQDGTVDRVRTFTTYETLSGWYPEFKSFKDLEQFGVDVTFF